MAIFDQVSKHAAYIALKLGKLKRDSVEYQSLQSTKDAILDLGKELSLTNGTNSPISTQQSYNSRPIPACKAFTVVDLVLAHNTTVKMPFETYDIPFIDKLGYDDLTPQNDKQAKFHSITVDNTKFFAHEEGKYSAKAKIRFPAHADAGVARAIIRYTRNGTLNTIIAESAVPLSTLHHITLNPCGDAYMFPGDYLELELLQFNAGATSLTVLGNTVSSFAIFGRI